MAYADLPSLPENAGLLPARLHHTERPRCRVGRGHGEETGTRKDSSRIHRGTGLAERGTLPSHCRRRLCGEHVQNEPLAIYYSSKNQSLANYFRGTSFNIIEIELYAIIIIMKVLAIIIIIRKP